MATATLRINALSAPAVARGVSALGQKRSACLAPGAKALRASAQLPNKAGKRAIGHVVKASGDDAFANYEPKLAFFFPGQGAQTPGMASELCAEYPSAKALFDQASEILKYDLLDVIANDAEKLNTTAVSQPAIFVASIAALEKLKAMDEGAEALEKVNVAAGLSLGEYTALCFADVMSFEDAVKLVQIRGESMQKAADANPSGMASVIGLGKDKVQDLVDAVNKEVGDDQSIKIANYLCNGNYAVSGGKEGIAKVMEIAKPDFKARMAVQLKVAGAFHTDYMASAADNLAQALKDTSFSTPRIPVVSNVDASPHSDPEVIKEILIKQLTGPVLWENTVETLIAKGCEGAYEIGPNKVIAGICKRIDKKFSVTNVETP